MVLFFGLTLEMSVARIPQAAAREVKRVTYAVKPKPKANVKLAVAMHRQEHALSCEAAALLMALRYRGVPVTETQLIQGMGFDPTPKRRGVWGDPQLAFVGDINGRQPSTGYGVYWEPIARVAAKYRRAEAATGKPMAELAGTLAQGNPVVVWGFVGSGQRIDWKTPHGAAVKAVMGEHARVAIGFSGPANVPTGFYLMDPIYGEIYMTRSQFDRNWSALDRGMVTIY